jgi:hypothetical protein
MAQFRKRPIVIEAVQYQPGGTIDGVIVFADDETRVPCYWTDEHGYRYPAKEGVDAFILTLEGPLHVSPGDWVITGIKGERYACKPDVFEATYEPVIR